LRVLIVGGGNSSHVLANRLLSSGHSVEISSNKKVDWGPIKLYKEQEIFFVKNRPKEFIYSEDPVPSYNLILFTTPSAQSIEFFNRFKSIFYTNPQVAIGFLYGQGYAPIKISNNLKAINGDRQLIFSLSALPWVCRVINYGIDVSVYWVNRRVFFGLNDARHKKNFVEGYASVLSDSAWGCEFIYGGDLVLASLNCTNQIIHPPRILNLIEARRNGWLREGDVPNFYVDIPNSAFESMERIDAELLLIKNKIIKRVDSNINLM
jgi:hypothetical protein